jgi:putative colanic acid biosynthesis acetyltransferase WcaF
VVLYSLGPITVGADCVISQRSYLCAGSHDYRSAAFDMRVAPVVVEDEAWIASDVFVGPGVRIGAAAVVGARSTVLRDLPPAMVCAGEPALPLHPRRTGHPAC